MYDAVCILKKTSYEDDARCNKIKTVVGREVFCEERSISQTEFYQAAQADFKPEVKLVLADYLDYDGESELEYEGVDYEIVRTYKNGAELEIVCQKRSKANGGNSKR